MNKDIWTIYYTHRNDKLIWRKLRANDLAVFFPVKGEKNKIKYNNFFYVLQLPYLVHVLIIFKIFYRGVEQGLNKTKEAVQKWPWKQNAKSWF